MPAFNTRFDATLSDPVSEKTAVPGETVARLFRYFSDCRLFRWQDANNDCEDRANAVCLLLDKWNIPNYKAWVFGGQYLKRDTGALSHNWKYHVAAALPVSIEKGIQLLVIDPATLSVAETIETWASGITDAAYSYHFAKVGAIYIFHPHTVRSDNWYSRNRQNYKWTIQGLAGINGVSKTGKAQLIFNKTKIKKTQKAFQQLLLEKPEFLY